MNDLEKKGEEEPIGATAKEVEVPKHKEIKSQV